MDLSGLVLGATYNNGDPADFTYGDEAKESILATGFTSEEIGNIDVTISYTEGEITKSAILTVSVVKTEVDEDTGEKTVTKIDDETGATVATTTDADGNVTKTVTTVTKEDGSTEETTTDSDGNITKTVTTVTGEDGTVTVTTENADGSKKIVAKKADGTSTETTIKTDADGTVTKTVVSKDKDGKITGTVETKTDKDGNAIITTTDADGNKTETKKTLESIEITTKPTKLTYTVGSELDKTGLKVTAKYSDKTEEDVTASVTITGFDSSKAAEKVTVKVTYSGKTATFDVKIEAKVELKSIAITTKPTKLTYTVGDKLDTTGIKVTATYTDGKTEDVTGKLTDKSYSGFDSSVAKDKVTVTVTYEGKTATFDVKVEAKAEEPEKPVATATCEVTDNVMTIEYKNQTVTIAKDSNNKWLEYVLPFKESATALKLSEGDVVDWTYTVDVGEHSSEIGIGYFMTVVAEAWSESPDSYNGLSASGLSKPKLNGEGELKKSGIWKINDKVVSIASGKDNANGELKKFKVFFKPVDEVTEGSTLKVNSAKVVLTKRTTVSAPEINSLDGENVTIVNPAPTLADVYYTTDGTEPTKESTKYSEPFAFTSDITVKAIAIPKYEGYTASEVVTESLKHGAAVIKVTRDVKLSNNWYWAEGGSTYKLKDDFGIDPVTIAIGDKVKISGTVTINSFVDKDDNEDTTQGLKGLQFQGINYLTVTLHDDESNFILPGNSKDFEIVWDVAEKDGKNPSGKWEQIELCYLFTTNALNGTANITISNFKFEKVED